MPKKKAKKAPTKKKVAKKTKVKETLDIEELKPYIPQLNIGLAGNTFSLNHDMTGPELKIILLALSMMMGQKFDEQSKIDYINNNDLARYFTRKKA